MSFPCLFMDRDGVLLEHVHHLRSPDEVRLITAASTAIARLNQHQVLAVVVTNQSVVARGLCTEDQLRTIHDKMNELLCSEGARLDGLYYCCHYPPDRLSKGSTDYFVDCECRKPKRGLIDRAVKDLRIDLGRSALVGDSTTDLETARRVRIPGILTTTGYAGRDRHYDLTPDERVSNLNQAVTWFLRRVDGYGTDE